MIWINIFVNCQFFNIIIELFSISLLPHKLLGLGLGSNILGFELFSPFKIPSLFQVDKNDDIYKVLNQNDASLHIQPGYCLKCGSYRDLESSHAAVDKASIFIKRYALFDLDSNKS